MDQICDECGVAIVAEYLPKHELRNLCLGCLDAADPMWREKQLGIKVIERVGMDVLQTCETGADCPTCNGSGLVGPAGHWMPCDAEGDNDCGEWYCDDGIVTNMEACWLLGVPHVHVGGRS